MNNIYSVTDKVLCDALNQSQITQNEMRDLFLSRGIIISKQTSRKTLSKNFSKFTHDYYDHQKIAEILGSEPRRERSTSKLISNMPDKATILRSAENLKKELTENKDLCHVVSDKTGTIKIHITYMSTNFSKSDFKQIVKKQAVIEIEPIDSDYVIRRPDNDQTEDYEQQLLSIIEELSKEKAVEDGKSISDAELDIHEISLENIDSSECRIEFFTKLINGLEGYDLDDVTDVYVYHPKPEEIEEENGEADIGVHVSKASLKGEGVLKSEEINSLYERGFYICRVKWRVKEKGADPNIFEFEAQFNNPQSFNNFSYIAKGMKKYKGHGEYNKTSTPLRDDQELFFSRLIEKKARSIIMDLTNRARGE
ncbi:hypothetical protein [Yersinia pseudotuberculosis]|uniref:Uncharacterized protein n=1 Tax=Yersinia pseudotuberculosis TaxID=633 RepID=A0A380Q434_YERPU|nr:hypothetical protein [Yersinia pseudotuberculosis]CND69596.1 Uncharacterised protein [Yersinia pseudotuberculosis]SUP80501.1 Uncharacterised protein [Yersinia pseudotuberculosis]